MTVPPFSPRLHSVLLRYGVALVAVLVTLGLRSLIQETGRHTPFILFLPAVALSATFGGRGPGLFALTAGVLAGLTLLSPGPLTVLRNPEWLTRLVISVFTGLVFCELAGRAHAANARLGESLRQLHIERDRLRNANEELQVQAEELQVQAEELQVQADEIRDQAEQLRESEKQLRELAGSLEVRVAERTAELKDSQERMAAFTYTVAHDLRAPLRAMHGYVEAMLDDLGDRVDEGVRDYAQRVVAAAQRMDLLIQDLLAYSRLRTAHLPEDAISLPVAVGMAVEDLAVDLAQRKARIEVRIGDDLPLVRGHGTTLSLAIGNLISNASKFVAPGTEPGIAVWAERREERVRLWVEDQGIGVPAEHQERIFGMFQRLHADGHYPGTGVGLAIVKLALDRMGGSVGVLSEPGRGSRFWIELPVAVAGAPRPILQPGNGEEAAVLDAAGAALRATGLGAAGAADHQAGTVPQPGPPQPGPRAEPAP